MARGVLFRRNHLRVAAIMAYEFEAADVTCRSPELLIVVKYALQKIDGKCSFTRTNSHPDGEAEVEESVAGTEETPIILCNHVQSGMPEMKRRHWISIEMEYYSQEGFLFTIY